MRWSMSFGVSGNNWTSNRLPPVLQKHYALLKPKGVHDAEPGHHLAGVGEPSEEVVQAITKHFNQFLHLRMSDGRLSYVWPSWQKEPVRCHPDDAIDYFQCNL